MSSGSVEPLRCATGTMRCIVTTGVGLQICLAAADQLTAAGIDATVLHFPTVKPLDTEALAVAAERRAGDCLGGRTLGHRRPG